ncbi:TPA: toll/interleukin-1 receptor domain-containing protein, partial [Klebsiella pneumoniae]|nr:toll/interleukin-1 receptor domain-containing protein [Klebsiella pneumoniae]
IPDDSFLLSGIYSTTLTGDLKLQNPIKKIRESITKSNGHSDSINDSINYEEFKKIWFPDVNAHVFISHSHVDKAKAIALANFLYSKFGIRSFVDSEVWGYMDDALLELNKNHNKFPGKENTYIYERCNKLASNLNMILSSALIKMIHESECLIFINTIDSCIRDGNEFRTKSPWIFTELLMSSMLEKRAHKDRPVELRKSIDESRAVVANEAFDQALFSYPLYLKHMHNVTNDKINRINEIKPSGLSSTTTVYRDTVYHFKVDDVFKNLDSIYKLVIYR